MTINEFKNEYWNYYLTLETDFLAAERYVAIDENNFATYSVEYIKQYQSICSEIDVILKAYCKFFGDKTEADSIWKYAKVICKERADLIAREVDVTKGRSIKIFIPWEH